MTTDLATGLITLAGIAPLVYAAMQGDLAGALSIGSLLPAACAVILAGLLMRERARRARLLKTRPKIDRAIELRALHAMRDRTR